MTDTVFADAAVMEGTHLIEIRAVAKGFGDLQVIRSAGFIARDGEITGLIGPNGAGKTTLFRLICTALRPDSGATFVDGITYSPTET